MAGAPKRTGGKILADQLRLHGSKLIFGVPGESYLPVIDALYDYRDTMPFIVCRQEGGAAIMAEAYGKLTGEPGICMVTRGPGATNASAGVHIARQDSTPMILFIGQAKRGFMDRESFQEVDFRQMFAPLVKWAAQIDDAARIPEYVSRAFHVAVSGRPGPVVLALPEDMLGEEAEAAGPQAYKRIEAHPSPEDMTQFRELLAVAKRPLVLVGGSGWDAKAAAQVQAFAEASGLPVAASFRRQDRFNNDHSCYVGDAGIGIDPRLAQTVRDADLLLALGARLGEIATSAYTLVEIPRPRQKLIHVYADPGELGRNYRADLPSRPARALLRRRWRRPGRWTARPGAAGGKKHARLMRNGRRRPVRLGCCSLRRSLPGCATRCRMTRSWSTMRVTFRSGCTAFSAIANLERSLRPFRARWVMAYRPPSRRSCCIPAAPWFPSRATAAS